MSQVLTVGEIARQVGDEEFRINYVLKKLSILPVGRAGGVRIFSPATVEVVRQYLAKHYKRRTPRINTAPAVY